MVCPVIAVTTDAEEEMMVNVVIEGETYQFLVDTGATKSCIKEGDLPLSGTGMHTQGFSGEQTFTPFTVPVVTEVGGVRQKLPLLHAPQSPVNLLGRDLMSKLRMTISATEEGGLVCSIPGQAGLYIQQVKKCTETEGRCAPTGSKVDLLRILQSFIPQHLWVNGLPWKGHFKKMTKTEGKLHTSSLEITGISGLGTPPQSWMAEARDDTGDKWFSVIQMSEGSCRDATPQWVLSQPQSYHVHIEPPIKTPVTCWSSHTNIDHISSDDNKILDTLPTSLWQRSASDVGFVKDAPPVEIKLKDSARYPRVKQYPISKEATEGIRQTIAEMLQAGVIVPCVSHCNTPLFPVKKPKGDGWRMVQDLRPLNSEVQAQYPVVPDPILILTNIPTRAKWFSVIDLSNGFFNLPLHPDSQPLTAFTFDGRQFMFTRLPQGYCESPSIFNQQVKRDLSNLQCESTVLQYVDDLLVCSATRKECIEDTLMVLTLLANKGYKVNRAKLQFALPQVIYLGQEISGEGRKITQERVESIQNTPLPTTVKEMQQFLGLVNYVRIWIFDYAALTAPLMELLKRGGKDNSVLQWTKEAEGNFAQLKTSLCQTPTLGIPDYEKVFHLFTHNTADIQTAVLTQRTSLGHKPIGYFSYRMDSVLRGMGPCEKGLATAAWAIEKTANIVLGCTTMLYTTHAIHAIMERSVPVLTVQRRSSYQIILEAPNIRVVKCTIVNPATFLAAALPEGSEVQETECAHEPNQETLYNIQEDPLPRTKGPWLFIDGSSFLKTDTGERGTGAAVVALEESGVYEPVALLSLNPVMSAQGAELSAIAAALHILQGAPGTIFSDSAYVCGVMHSGIAKWERRGYCKSDGSPVVHAALLKEVKELLDQRGDLPLAVVKCAAHTQGKDEISLGNEMADQMAKQAAEGRVSLDKAEENGEDSPGVRQMVQINLENIRARMDDVRAIQERATQEEAALWKQKGGYKSTLDGIWKHEKTGCSILPHEELLAIGDKLHQITHSGASRLERQLREDWFHPNMTLITEQVINDCKTCQLYKPHKTLRANKGRLSRGRFPFEELHIDYVDMIDRCQKKRYMIVVVCPFSRWVEAGACRNESAAAAVDFLLRDVIPRWGLPRVLQSDNGSHFVNQLFDCLSARVGVKLRRVSVYRPQSNGIAERMNGLLKNKIAQLCAASGQTWLHCLPLALMALRSTPGSDHGLTPHEIVTGRAMRGVGEAEMDNDYGTSDEYVEYFKLLTKISSDIYQQRPPSEDEEDPDGPAITLTPGDQVYIKRFTRKWNEPKFEGPFQVILTTEHAAKVLGREGWIHKRDLRKKPE